MWVGYLFHHQLHLISLFINFIVKLWCGSIPHMTTGCESSDSLFWAIHFNWFHRFQENSCFQDLQSIFISTSTVQNQLFRFQLYDIVAYLRLHIHVPQKQSFTVKTLLRNTSQTLCASILPIRISIHSRTLEILVLSPSLKIFDQFV